MMLLGSYVTYEAYYIVKLIKHWEFTFEYLVVEFTLELVVVWHLCFHGNLILLLNYSLFVQIFKEFELINLRKFEKLLLRDGMCGES